MTHITENGWTLRYTDGGELASAVETGDAIPLPSGRHKLIVLGGRAPQRVNDCGGVIVNDQRGEITGERELRPSALGMVWVSSSGGWSELPRAPAPPDQQEGRTADSCTAKGPRRVIDRVALAMPKRPMLLLGCS